jgi:hypothetical protein
MKCATCGQDDSNPCSHLANDPVLTPDAQLAIVRQKFSLAPKPPQSAEQPKQI